MLLQKYQAHERRVLCVMRHMELRGDSYGILVVRAAHRQHVFAMPGCVSFLTF